MSRVSRITRYNPKKSVHENAVMNGVSDAAMYLYLRNNNKGRGFENAKSIVKEIKKVLKEHKGQSLSQAKVAEITGHSVTTINKYWKAAQGEVEIKSTQVERTEKKRDKEEMQTISTISPNAINDILNKAKFSKDICCLGTSFSLFKDNLSMSGYSVENSLRNDADIISCPSLAELSTSFMEECLQSAKKHVAFLMPLSRLSDNQLFESLFGVFPPSLVLPYTSNIGVDGSIINGYAWFLWIKGKKGSTNIEWAHKKVSQGPSAKALELKKKIDALVEQEHKCTATLKDNPAFLPIPTKEELRNVEHYDMTKHYCIAFRSKTDYWKDMWVPFGNMNGGFEYEMNGVQFPTSEQSYIFGVFSSGSKEHSRIQNEVLNANSGYDAKRDIRKKNANKERADWGEFNIDWMIYCVWQKVQKNEEFRRRLMAIPQGVTIIEDTSFKNKPDMFWGCLNTSKKEFGKLAKKYSKSLNHKTKAAANRLVDELLWDYCNVGEYVGKNVMGKILTIIKDCLHNGTEPDIDYDLLKRKHIHFFGQEISFDPNEIITPIIPQNTKTKYELSSSPIRSILGGVLGDISGSTRESSKKSIYTTDFTLFPKGSSVTDDSCLTIAIADWLLHRDSVSLSDSLRGWGMKYPNAKYGSGFKVFIATGFPYCSDKNGAAMRVSPVAIYAKSLEETLALAKESAILTHNSEEGIKGAQAIAASIFIVRDSISKGKDAQTIKAEVKEYVEEHFGYDLGQDIEAIRERSKTFARMEAEYRKTGISNPEYKSISDASVSCPMAIIAFLKGDSYENAIRVGISMGGDSDTIACMAGSISAQLYGIPSNIIEQGLRYVPIDMLEIIEEFDDKYINQEL